MTVREIASLLDGDVVGDAAEDIVRLAKIEEAGRGDLTFLANPKYEKYLETTAASAVIVNRTLSLAHFAKLPPALIQVADPYASFVVALEKLSPRPVPLAGGIHPAAVVSSSAKIGTNASIGAYVVIGDQCEIGNNAKIFPGTVIGNAVHIGDDCLIYANVVIREQCLLGNRVIIQPGAVVGSDGFGFAPKRDGSYQKIPQLGIVVIEDDVEIGANTCVDRATMGETRVRHGTKLDNMVQIAHNVAVGENTVIAGQSGIAGSTRVGNRVMIGGNVGITGHIAIADKVSIAGNSGVTKSLSEEGQTYFGYPAREASKTRRIEGALRQLPELLFTIREMERRIAKLEKKLEDMRAGGNR